MCLKLDPIMELTADASYSILPSTCFSNMNLPRLNVDSCKQPFSKGKYIKSALILQIVSLFQSDPLVCKQNNVEFVLLYFTWIF